MEGRGTEKLHHHCLKRYIMFFFFQRVEETVNLRCVTHGSLKTSRSKFNPESGQIKFSLQGANKGWKLRQGIQKWDPKSSTFQEIRSQNTNLLLKIFI